MHIKILCRSIANPQFGGGILISEKFYSIRIIDLAKKGYKLLSAMTQDIKGVLNSFGDDVIYCDKVAKNVIQVLIISL